MPMTLYREEVVRQIAQGIMNIEEGRHNTFQKGSPFHEALKVLMDPDIAEPLKAILIQQGCKADPVRKLCPVCRSNRFIIGKIRMLPEGDMLVSYPGSYQCERCETYLRAEISLVLVGTEENVKEEEDPDDA